MKTSPNELFDQATTYATTMLMLLHGELTETIVSDMRILLHGGLTEAIVSDAAEWLANGERLKVHFLFPNLTVEERQVISDLAVSRMAISVSINQPDERSKTRLEADFVELSQQAREISGLTVEQQDILASRFLSNPLAED